MGSGWDFLGSRFQNPGDLRFLRKNPKNPGSYCFVLPDMASFELLISIILTIHCKIMI